MNHTEQFCFHCWARKPFCAQPHQTARGPETVVQCRQCGTRYTVPRSLRPAHPVVACGHTIRPR